MLVVAVAELERPVSQHVGLGLQFFDFREFQGAWHLGVEHPSSGVTLGSQRFACFRGWVLRFDVFLQDAPVHATFTDLIELLLQRRGDISLLAHFLQDVFGQGDKVQCAKVQDGRRSKGGFVAHFGAGMDVVAHVVMLVVAFDRQGDLSQRGEFPNGVGFDRGVVAWIGSEKRSRG